MKLVIKHHAVVHGHTHRFCVFGLLLLQFIINIINLTFLLPILIP